MKLISAYIQRFITEKVTDALRQINIHGVTVLNCEGFGQQTGGDHARYLDKEAETGFAPKTKLEIICLDEDVGRIVQTIRESAHTGHHGEGKIFVTEVITAVDIRTGIRGESIL